MRFSTEVRLKDKKWGGFLSFKLRWGMANFTLVNNQKRIRFMRVLSLFDGMSCGQIALRDMGIVPEVYYASEVDKFAIAQTQLNFPDTIQLGDVRQLNVENLIGGG